MGDGKPHHEVASEVYDCTDEEEAPGWCDFRNEAGDDTNVCTQVFEKAYEVKGGLVVPIKQRNNTSLHNYVVCYFLIGEKTIDLS